MMLTKRLLNRLGRPFGVNPFPRAFPNPIAVGSGSAAAVFDEIHRANFWGSGESLSGVGSELAFTATYRRGLARCLANYGIQSLFDAPCGDLNWMSVFLTEHPVDYAGGDISADVVTRAQAAHPGRDLRVFDITTDPFPEAEVWHCRDCLFHLPFDAIQQALANFAASNIGYVLITSHRARLLHRNLDVGFGGFRFLDLERAPFFLPPSLERIPDYRRGHDFPRYVCLWSRDQIAQAIARWS
jgi:SAM-dependent methyltransferase